MSHWITDTQASKRFPVYTRSNASDVLPDPISPLGASLAFIPGTMEGWRDGNVRNGSVLEGEVHAEGFNPVCGFFNGFFYVNASVVRLFGVRAGVGAEPIDLAFFGTRPDTPPYVPHPDDPNETVAKQLGDRANWALTITEYPELEESKRVAKEIRAKRPNLAEASDAQLVEYARSLIPVHRRMFDDHVMTSTNTATGPTVLGQIVPDLLVRIIAGAGDVDSAAPSHAMWALSRLPQNSPEFQQGFEDFLYEFGSRGPNEWDLFSDVWETKPALALALIDAMRQVGPDGDPAKAAARTVADSAAALTEALDRVKGNDEATTMVQLAATSGRRFNAWRERSKTNCIRVMNEARVAMREIGRRHAATGALAHEKQVFMLLNEELDAFIADPKSFTSKLAEREKQWRSLWELETPYFVEGDKRVPDIEELPKRAEVKVEKVKTGDVLQGNAGCSGVARGRARVILDPADPSALEEGDILIAPNTDPSWTPLFIPAGGVVVDVGALNSHSIIVSRELGIPCVVSVVNATRRIPDGATIEVNGDLGTVTILEG